MDYRLWVIELLKEFGNSVNMSSGRKEDQRNFDG